jgi:hypothetical protein
MTRSRLHRFARMAAVALAGIVVLAAVGHGVVWWQATEALKREADRWVAARQAEGIVVRHGRPVRGGWPWAARLTLPAIVADGALPVQGQGMVPAKLSAAAVRLELALAEPRVLRIALDSPFTLDVGPGVTARGQAARFEIAVPLRPGPDGASTLMARGLRIDTGGQVVGADQLELRLTRDPRAQGEMPALAMTLAAAGVELPPSSGPVLGTRVARAELDMQVIGQVPGFGSPHAQAVAWRDAGGFVQIPRLLLDWGPLSLSADATLALDQAAQPSGAGRARAAGLGPTLEVLANAGVIPRQAAQAGRSVIAFMQRTPAGGGPPVVELPLTLQDRTLSAGRITLLHLPPLVLPR